MIVRIILLVSYIICGIVGQLLFLLQAYDEFRKIDKDDFAYSILIFCLGWAGFISMLFLIFGKKIYKIVSNWNLLDDFLEKLESFIKKLSRSR